MSTIVTRAGKGSALSWNEVDANFTNLNTDKIQAGNTVSSLTITSITVNGGTIQGITDLAIADGGTGASTVTGARENLLPSYAGNNGKVLALNSGATDVEWIAVAGTGTVTSVAITLPTGLVVSGSPITTSGTFAISFDTGYSIPTTAKQTEWDTAYTDRLKWDGGSTGLNASTGRTSLGLGTISTQDANNVSITGGSVTGITDIAVADGGTGASTAAGARTNLLPSYSGNNGKVLAVNSGSTDVEWVSVSGTGTVTSVALTMPTGFSVSGSPVTSSGTLAVSTTLNGIIKGDGSGFSAASAGTDYLAPAAIGTTVLAYDSNLQSFVNTFTLPTTDSTAGYVLSTNGSGTLSWTANGSGSMVYPGAGIPNSTGSAWGTSYTTSGSGTVVALATSPSFTTPTLGVATATSINKVALTAPATSATLTIADGKTLTANNSITLAGTDSTTMTFPSTSQTVVGTTATQTLTNKTIIPSINAQTGTTYTLALSDASKMVTLSNASSITVTVPPNSSVAFDTGTMIDFAQIGAGQVTFAAGSGVTLNGTPGLKCRAQYSGASLIKLGTNTWLLVGDLSA